MGRTLAARAYGAREGLPCFQFDDDAAQRKFADVLDGVDDGRVEAGVVRNDVADHFGCAIRPLLKLGAIQLNDHSRAVAVPRASFANNMDAVLESLTPSQRAEFRPVAIELKAGECSFHDPLMVHGSYANSTDQPRRAVVLNAFRDGVESASDAPLLEGVPPVPVGEKLGGQFFPLLFDPATS